ncbi:hypothetical protein JCM33374_g6578 [Metschnikowia sp. JCM 33374]|nr:hypothetical protein JCM33374_g6578 [Metschnikowia sp. JCM 33374]
MLDKILCEYQLEEESCLFWRRGPSKGLTTVELPGSNVDKSRITITFCTNANGTDKSPLHFIGKSRNPRDLGAREKSTYQWNWRSSKTACMTADLMDEWLIDFYIHIGDRSAPTFGQLLSTWGGSTQNKATRKHSH